MLPILGQVAQGCGLRVPASKELIGQVAEGGGPRVPASKVLTGQVVVSRQ